MGKYVVATIKSWNIENYSKIRERYSDKEFILIDKPDKLSFEAIESIDPDYIFFPHWSWIIPENIYDNYNCVVFHMTDLPFGRGGSPLQNLLVRGIYNTKISAIKVCADLDAGPIYLKEPLDISQGSADEILKRASDIIFDKMIPLFFSKELVLQEQIGEIVTFRRRTPAQSEIPAGLLPRQLYDYIRMLDGEGYPNAFIQFGTGKVFFNDAKIENEVVTAEAKFVSNNEEIKINDM